MGGVKFPLISTGHSYNNFDNEMTTAALVIVRRALLSHFQHWDQEKKDRREFQLSVDSVLECT